MSFQNLIPEDWMGKMTSIFIDGSGVSLHFLWVGIGFITCTSPRSYINAKHSGIQTSQEEN
jgi:hypothetical protein